MSLRKFKWLIICMVVLSFSLTGCSKKQTSSGNASAASDKTVTLIMSVGTAQNLKEGGLYFKELVERKTNGSIQINYFPDSQLGDDREATETTQFGDIDIAACSTSQMASLYTNMLAFDTPFLFRDFEEADRILDGPGAKAILDEMEKVGLKGLVFWESGFRNLTNNKKEVRVPDDVRGLRIRTMENPVVLGTWRSFGANPTPMAFSEIFPGLQQGTIDGQENPLAIIYANKLHEIQKYISMTGHLYGPYCLFMNLDKFNSLSSAHQQAILEAAKETTPYQREISRKYEQEIKDAIIAAGNVVSDLTIAEKTEWQRVIAAANIQDMIKQNMANPDLLNGLK